jgi:hypothetical protein
VHLQEKETVQQSATTTTRELLQFRGKARIPIQKEYNIIVKISYTADGWRLRKIQVELKS